jgi:hypothetical protein
MNCITKEDIIQWRECGDDSCTMFIDGPENEKSCEGCIHSRQIGPFIAVSKLIEVLRDMGINYDYEEVVETNIEKWFPGLK